MLKCPLLILCHKQMTNDIMWQANDIYRTSTANDSWNIEEDHDIQLRSIPISYSYNILEKNINNIILWIHCHVFSSVLSSSRMNQEKKHIMKILSFLSLILLLLAPYSASLLFFKHLYSHCHREKSIHHSVHTPS